MLFYKFHGAVAVKTFFIFLKLNILRAVLRDLFVLVSSKITENNILRFSEKRT